MMIWDVRASAAAFTTAETNSKKKTCGCAGKGSHDGAACHNNAAADDWVSLQGAKHAAHVRVQRIMAMAFVSSEHAILRRASSCGRKQQRGQLQFVQIFPLQGSLEHIYQVPSAVSFFGSNDLAVMREVGCHRSAHDSRGNRVGPKEFAFL